MRQELTISISHSIPVNPMHIDIVETFLMLFVHMVKHCFTFGSQIHFHFSLIADGLQRIRLGIHLLHNPASQQKNISFFVQHQRYPTGIEFVQTLRIFFTEIHFPKVISIFERREIVKIFPVF